MEVMGNKICLEISTFGHYILPLSRSTENLRDVQSVLFCSPIQPGEEINSIKKKVVKWHKQFAHPLPEKLKKLIHDSGIDDDQIDKIVDEISISCDTCKRYKRPNLRPAVGFSLAQKLNDTVAMDLVCVSRG